MFTEKELDDLREMQEDFFNCRIIVYPQDRAARDDVDPDTLEIVKSGPDALYDGPGFLQPTTRNYEHSADWGEARHTTRTYNCRIRWDMDELQINDVIKVYNTKDPMLEGKELIVIDPQVDSNATVRYFIAELQLGH